MQCFSNFAVLSFSVPFIADASVYFQANQANRRMSRTHDTAIRMAFPILISLSATDRKRLHYPPLL